MEWKKYLSLLNWQGQRVTFDDLNYLEPYSSSIHHFDDLQCFIEKLPCTKLKKYCLENKKWKNLAEHHIQECQKNSIRLTWPGRPDYPKLLEFYKNSPTLLSYKGVPAWNKSFQFCVVGSRKSSPETLSWMDHHLDSFLSGRDICLLSGGAKGIDQKSHSVALRAKIPTICFLPCGLNHLYPANLKEWSEKFIENQGALISPFPPNTSIRKSFFHYRNSLMVRMSHLVLIAQAEERSGSSLTARLASLYGVTLCTLPGPVMNPLFKGNLNLINQGAFMIQDAKDLEVLYHTLQTSLCP